MTRFKNAGTSKAELRGVLILALIISIAVALPHLYRALWPGQLPADGTIDISQIRAMPDTTGKRVYSSKINKKSQRPHFATRKQETAYPERSPLKSPERVKAIVCHRFDPNTVEADTLIAMGITTYVAKNLIGYRNAGGKFRSTQDLLKIYGIDSNLVGQLSACIEIIREPAGIAASRFEINTATAEELKALPGIGDVLAARIVNFREHLGGFTSISQLGETYGLSEETMSQIKDRLTLTTGPKQINLNTASMDELAAHPYISKRQAQTIVNYRTNHGDFASVDDIMRIYSLDQAWLTRMEGYLTCGKSQGPEPDVAFNR